MTQEVAIDIDKAVVLIMDFQQRVVNNRASDPQAVVLNASQALHAAREAGIPVINVVHRGGAFQEYAPDVEIHQGVSPAAGETVFTKTKPGPFSTTALDVTLKDMGKDTLVVMGVATGGCVLSAVRWATDINYKFIVLSDACSDEDPEVHRVLTEKIFPRRGTVMTTQQFLEAI